LSRC
jgi:hypothetical protein